MKAIFQKRVSNGPKAFRISFFRRKLFPMLLLIMTFFLALGIIVSNIVETSIKRKLDNDSIMLLTQTKRSFESVMSEIYALTLILTYDTSTAKTIKNCLQSNNVHYSDVQNIKSSIVIPLVATRSYIDSIYIYFDNSNGVFFANTEGIRSLERYYDTGWYAKVTSPEFKDKMIWSEARTYYKYEFDSDPNEIVTLYQRNLYRDGIIVLNLNRDFFNRQLNELSSYEGQIIYIFDEDGKVLFCNDKAPGLTEIEVTEMLYLESGHEKSRDYYLSSAKADFIPEWTFVSIVPKKSLYAPIRQINLSILLIMILACILGSILASLRVWQSYRSIHRIMTFIDDIKKNPHGTMPMAKEPQEYEFIVESLVEAYTRENALSQQLLSNKYTQKVLELKSLQAQINPHFLLNTLQSIFWASFHLTNSYNNVSKMIENLNTILGYLLESDCMLVPMEKELRNLESYISIQQIRSSRKFEMVWDVPESLYSIYTVKLLFQPLLENAIQHGFSGSGHWVLKFRVRSLNDRLFVTILDNGNGIAKPELELLRTRLFQADLPSGGHIGLYNSSRRLQLLFGSEYHITIDSKKGMGTRIQLILPLITEDNLKSFL